VRKSGLHLRFEPTGALEAAGGQPTTVEMVSYEEGVEVEVTGEIGEPGPLA
jgi:hypothetical protein